MQTSGSPFTNASREQSPLRKAEKLFTTSADLTKLIKGTMRSPFKWSCCHQCQSYRVMNSLIILQQEMPSRAVYFTSDAHIDSTCVETGNVLHRMQNDHTDVQLMGGGLWPFYSFLSLSINTFIICILLF